MISLPYLHDLGITASDVKPSNILPAGDWMFEIANFSVETLKRSKDEKDLTYTLCYLAPELMVMYM